MNNYDSDYLKDYGLEFYILSCLIIYPNYMEKIFLEDKYFQEYQRLWIFMKAFYEKFKTFDIKLMRSVCKDKFHISNYIQMMVDCGPLHKPTDDEFKKYQEYLIERYNESKKDVWIIERIYELANRLYVRKIDVKQFNSELEYIYTKANKIFEGDKNDIRF